VADRLAGRRARPTLVTKFWTSRQRAAHSLHEISYRACFKPQLPRFFIDRLTGPGAVVYDPFAGRGTTPLEAALAGRVPVACDINPLSRMLLEAPPLSAGDRCGSPPPGRDRPPPRRARSARPGGVLHRRRSTRLRRSGTTCSIVNGHGALYGLDGLDPDVP